MASDTKAPVVDPVGKTSVQAEPPKTELPARIKVIHAHGFIDEDGRNRFWKGGEVIAGADEIALLIGRGASVETVA